MRFPTTASDTAANGDPLIQCHDIKEPIDDNQLWWSLIHLIREAGLGDQLNDFNPNNPNTYNLLTRAIANLSPKPHTLAQTDQTTLFSTDALNWTEFVIPGMPTNATEVMLNLTQFIEESIEIHWALHGETNQSELITHFNDESEGGDTNASPPPFYLPTYTNSNGQHAIKLRVFSSDPDDNARMKIIGWR